MLNVAITHIPACHRNVDLQDHSLFPVRTELGGIDTLQSLCLVNKANLPAVRALMHGMDNLLTEAAKAVPTTTSGLSQAPPDMTTSCTFHPGFMSDPAVTAAVAESLDTDYQQACSKSIDVDERPFLGRAAEAPPTPGPSAAPPSLSKCLVGSPQGQASCLVLAKMPGVNASDCPDSRVFGIHLWALVASIGKALLAFDSGPCWHMIWALVALICKPCWLGIHLWALVASICQPDLFPAGNWAWMSCMLLPCCVHCLHSFQHIAGFCLLTSLPPHSSQEACDYAHCCLQPCLCIALSEKLC